MLPTNNDISFAFLNNFFLKFSGNFGYRMYFTNFASFFDMANFYADNVVEYVNKQNYRVWLKGMSNDYLEQRVATKKGPASVIV